MYVGLQERVPMGEGTASPPQNVKITNRWLGGAGLVIESKLCVSRRVVDHTCLTRGDELVDCLMLLPHQLHQSCIIFLGEPCRRDGLAHRSMLGLARSFGSLGQKSWP